MSTRMSKKHKVINTFVSPSNFIKHQIVELPIRPTNVAAPEYSLSNSELTEDLIVEILLRLPIKKLTRCKTVSKQWLRLISSPSFAFRRFQIRTFRRRPSFFVLCNLVTEALVAPVSFSASRKLMKHPHINLPHNDGRWIRYRLLPAGYGIYCLYDFSTGNVSLWNPTTKEHKVLPPSPSSDSHMCSFASVYYKDGNFSYKVGRVTSTKAPSSDMYTPDTLIAEKPNPQERNKQ